MDAEPAGGSEGMSRSEEEQRQRDGDIACSGAIPLEGEEDTGAASGGEMTPYTIGSGADGVSSGTVARQEEHPGKVQKKALAQRPNECVHNKNKIGRAHV